jgi:hypothetical protein
LVAPSLRPESPPWSTPAIFAIHETFFVPVDQPGVAIEIKSKPSNLEIQASLSAIFSSNGSSP